MWVNRSCNSVGRHEMFPFPFFSSPGARCKAWPWAFRKEEWCVDKVEKVVSSTQPPPPPSPHTPDPAPTSLAHLRPPSCCLSHRRAPGNAYLHMHANTLQQMHLNMHLFCFKPGCAPFSDVSHSPAPFPSCTWQCIIAHARQHLATHAPENAPFLLWTWQSSFSDVPHRHAPDLSMHNCTYTFGNRNVLFNWVWLEW